MIDFQPFDLRFKADYDRLIQCGGERGCEYGFVNLFLWGRQKAAYVAEHLVFFSQFQRRSVYLFPVGCTDKRPALEAIIHDAKTRGIPCRLTGMNALDCQLLEFLYPGQFHFHPDRDSFDYIYDINDLADLKGKKFQKKRNHLNRFWQNNPDATVEPITDENCHEAAELANKWYQLRLEIDPHGDFRMEQTALARALRHRKELGFEGLLLKCDGKTVAMTLGSRLREDTFDIHFEKALDMADGAYAAINNSFAKYLREKYPQVRFLDREDDMGLEGLRKAKLSYNPHHMIEKYWACLMEDGYEY